ncbi:MAG TPA: hypothetical protein PK609_00515 [Candidatus Paceibacterota bacterium]|nr:hypothetical protein [Candidatus Paceibacterota bacterium]
MGFLRRGVPPADVVRNNKDLAQGCAALFGNGRNEPEQKGVKTVGAREEKRWNKKARRYRYDEGIVIDGVKVGGRFTTAPSYAPAHRKKGAKKKSRG